MMMAMWWVFKIARAYCKRVGQRIGVCRARCGELQAEEAAPDVLWCGSKFCNLTLVSLFSQASRSQEATQESTTPHLLKLDACDRAILLTFVGVFAKFELCVYIYLSM